MRCSCPLLPTGALLICAALTAQTPSLVSSHPEANEIPLPAIRTAMKPLPGPDALPLRPAMPDVLYRNNGKVVTTPKQWQQRRAEMRRTLEYYAVGQAPPPPGNVKGEILQTQLLRNGTIRYRLVRLSFGPQQSLSLNIGIFTPAQGGTVPTVIAPFGTPPGATPLPRLPLGANQGKGEDVLTVVGPAHPQAAPSKQNPPSAEEIAAANPALAHGYAFVTFDNNDCGEDSTLRLPDGSWAYRTTRFFPAYPNYDWGLLRAWAWGVSRIVDYLQTDPAIDATKLIVTGVSRTGKAAMVAGAFDDRLALVAPVASSGGGTPAYRFSGAGRGGHEGLTEMVRKYPNWFSPHLHEFWGQPDKLPFDAHWFVALVAPRPFIALEGTQDPNVSFNGVYQTLQSARPAYVFLAAEDHLGIAFANRPHGIVAADWQSLLAFADKTLLGKPQRQRFDRFPSELLLAK